MPVGGKLTLKGGLELSSKKTKKKKKSKKRKSRDGESAQISETDKHSEGDDNAEVVLEKKKGTGRIITSGTTVHGKETKFLQELSIGDVIIITHPSSLMEETRLVRMVLSDLSISISSPFSSDLISSTSFWFLKAPKEDTGENDEQRRKRQRESEESKFTFGTYAGGTARGSMHTYRVKKSGAYGGYTIMKAESTKEMSREDLLDMRSKKKADRHCY